MSADAINPTKAFDKLVLDATAGATIGENYQAMLDALHSAGAQSQQSNESMPAAHDYKFEKTIRWAESTGKRPMVLRAMTQEDLDLLERQITEN